MSISHPASSRDRTRQLQDLLLVNRDAEEFGLSLFSGRFEQQWLFPWPHGDSAQTAIGTQKSAELKEILAGHIDAAAIDTTGNIPPELVATLAKIGFWQGAVSTAQGGQGWSLATYSRLFAEVAAVCGSTATMANLIIAKGIVPLLKFGTETQKQTWLSSFLEGKAVPTFAGYESVGNVDSLTVQTHAVITPDGQNFLVSGTKGYVPFGGNASVLLVLARTPAVSANDGQVSAFLVTPGQYGYEANSAPFPTSGNRGIPYARICFDNLIVPRSNLLGPLGKGDSVTLEMWERSQLGLAAICCGSATACVNGAAKFLRDHSTPGMANSVEDVDRGRIAKSAALQFAIESTVEYVSLSGSNGNQLAPIEVAMLKVFATESLLEITEFISPLYAEASVFASSPIDRIHREARHHLVSEGCNDLLRQLIAKAGVRALHQQIQQVRSQPWKFGQLLRPLPAIPVANPRVQPAVAQLSRQIQHFSRTCQQVLAGRPDADHCDPQSLARLADLAIELFVASCTYARMFAMLGSRDHSPETARQLQAGLLFLKMACRRNEGRLSAMHEHDDDEVRRTADTWLG